MSYSVIELATKLRCHRQTIYNKIKSGELEKYATKTEDGVRFNEDDLEEIMSIIQVKSTCKSTVKRQSNDNVIDILKKANDKLEIENKRLEEKLEQKEVEYLLHVKSLQDDLKNAQLSAKLERQEERELRRADQVNHYKIIESKLESIDSRIGKGNKLVDGIKKILRIGD